MLLHETGLTTATTADVTRVRAAIAQLPPVERDLLVLRFDGDRDVDELVVATGVPRETILGRLHHAAWVVHDLAGLTPAQWGEPEPPLLPYRDPLLVEEDAALGITPLLAARLAAAVAGAPPPADEHWRLRAVLRGLRMHADGVLMALLLTAVTVPVTASLGSM